jgi:NAD(P)-dependent dehydrogenase (short-subunit alcohol dehydrogenase family)
MARELADHGIRVNVIAPGIVNAGLAGEQLRTDPGYAARVQKVIALEGLQSPDDVAGGMVFLCSPAADQMTGSVLLIDGGCSLYRFD